MKKFLATILAFIYLSTSMGATLHLHYCMGKLISWGLFDQNGKNCAFCGMPKKTDNKHCGIATAGCCKDEHKQIKTDKDQKLVQSEYQALTIFPEAVADTNHKLLDFGISSITIGYPNVNAPPSPGKVPVFLLNRNFRI